MISDIRKRIENEMTPIVAFGLITLASIAVFLLLSKLGDAANERKNDVLIAKTDLVTLQQLEGDSVWNQRLKTSEKELASMHLKTWKGPTSGVVSAFLEERLVEMLNEMQAKRILISVDPEPQQLKGIETISFDMKGQVPSHMAVIDLLALMEGNKRRIWINDTTISFNGNGVGAVTITGLVPIKITESGG